MNDNLPKEVRFQNKTISELFFQDFFFVNIRIGYIYLEQCQLQTLTVLSCLILNLLMYAAIVWPLR